ncbi:hypothetical protein DFJ74DRAFT_657251 [Hyaloraphidium curvatum]|nr:hypothetical protein DFJ74DRAFT_657251 [Hyaloraphidium curvatum]
MSLLKESHLMKCGAPAKLPDSAFGAGAPYLPRLHDAPMVALDLGRRPENMSLHMAQSLVGPVLKTCLGMAADARFTWVAKLRFGPNGYPWLYLIPTEGSLADRDQFVKTLEDQKFLPIKLRSGTDWRIRIVKTLREHDLLVPTSTWTRARSGSGATGSTAGLRSAGSRGACTWPCAGGTRRGSGGSG